MLIPYISMVQSKLEEHSLKVLQIIQIIHADVDPLYFCSPGPVNSWAELIPLSS